MRRSGPTTTRSTAIGRRPDAPACARTYPRHRRHRICRLAPPRQSRRSARRWSAGYRPGGQPPDPDRHIDWQGVDLTDRDSGRRGGRGGRARRRSSTSPARPTWRPPGRARCRTSQRTCSARITCSRRCGGRGGPCRVLVVSSAQIYQVERRSDRRERAARARRIRTACRSSRRISWRCSVARDDGSTSSSLGRSTTSGRGRQPGFAVSSFARQIARIEARPGAAGASASAISKRGATSPTCETSCAPTAGSWSGGASGRAVQHLLRTMRGGFAICSTSSCTSRRRRLTSRSTPPAFGGTTCPSSRATAAGFAPSSTGRPRFASSRRSATPWTGGGRRSRHRKPRTLGG